jgi:hypothetical protein
VTFPLGTNAKNLTASANGIGTLLPEGWSAVQNGGLFTLTPTTPGAAKVGPNGLSFVFTGITVNDKVGTCAIAIGEQASAPGKPSAQRTTSFPLAKFPPTFTLSQLTLSSFSVTPGGSLTLFWTGSPGATYLLSYDKDGTGVVPTLVSSNGPFSATNLTAPVIVFTLSATVTVPGEDSPLVYQRQAVATVSVARVTFFSLPSSVGVNGVAKLIWQTIGTTSRTLDPGSTSVPANGYAYVAISATKTFTLTAIETGTQRPIVQQQTISVDAAIVPTSTQNYVGQPGAQGPAGAGGGNQYPGGSGGWGGPGQSVGDVTVSLGPLDASSTPQKVVMIAYSGGNGGRGGNGGNGNPTGGIGGNGNNGGDAGALTIQFAATGTPQQVILSVAASSRGEGGTGGVGTQSGKMLDGQHGNPGRAPTVRFVELPPSASGDVTSS